MDILLNYTLHLIRKEEEFYALQPEWTRLYEEATPRNPFFSYDWTAACWAHMCPDATPFILTARSAGRLVGVAPLCLERKLGFRVLRFMGDRRSDYLGFLQAPDHLEVSVALLNHLTHVRRCWDIAVLRHICDLYTDLNPGIVPQELCSTEIEATVSPYLCFPGDWDELCASGSEQLRHTRRPARKFERDGGIVERVTGCEAATIVDQIVEVEAHSWKVRHDAARFQSKQDQRLLRQVLATFGQRDEVEVWLARMNDQPVAFLINFVTPERVCYYQGSYHEDYRKYYPGGVLHFYAIRNAWQVGLREYDFMRGNEGYKAGWTNGQRSLRYLALFPNTLRGHLAFATLVAPRWHLRTFQPAQVAYRFYGQLKNILRWSLPSRIVARRWDEQPNTHRDSI